MQITTDGPSAYLEASEGAFGGDVDQAMLVKVYGNTPDSDRTAKTRYSPGHCTSTHVIHVSGHRARPLWRRGSRTGFTRSKTS